MSEIGNIIIYIIMAGTLLGAMASVIKPESGLGKEFVNGIHSIGPVFLAQAGIMAAIPILSYAITYTVGPCSNQWDRMRPLPPCRLSPLIWAAISWQTRSRLIVINGSQPCWLATPPVPVSFI